MSKTGSCLFHISGQVLSGQTLRKIFEETGLVDSWPQLPRTGAEGDVKIMCGKSRYLRPFSLNILAPTYFISM